MFHEELIQHENQYSQSADRDGKQNIDQRTGSPFIWVFKGEGQAVVDCSKLDAAVRTVLWPLCILQQEEAVKTWALTDWLIND